MGWKGLKDHLVPNLLLWAGPPFTKPGCSEHDPTSC